MATTKYDVLAGNDTVKSGVTKKAQAVEVATAHRNENGVAVSVQTQSGTVVFELAAPKKIKMSPRYSRTVDLPEGVTVPEGARVAYFRPRVALALLHFGEAGEYAVLDTKAGKVLKPRFATTREGGVFLRERALEAKAAKAQAELEAAQA